MPKFAANLTMLFNEMPFLDMILAPKKWSEKASVPTPTGNPAAKISPGRRGP